MKPITERTLIRRVAARWRKQYPPHMTEADKNAIGDQLDALDTDTATGEEVARIIGNKSWTGRECNECQAINEDVVEFSSSSSATCLCAGCLRDALNLIER